MIPEPYTPTEDDLAEFLFWSAREREPGIRTTVDPWPETIMAIADKVAVQGKVLPADRSLAIDLFESWLNELDAAEG